MYKIYFKRLYFLILHAKFTLKMIFPYNWKLKFRDSFQSSFYAILPPPHFAVVIICLVFVIGLRNVLWCWLA